MSKNKIILTKTFNKLLSKIWSISKQNIIDLIKKYPNSNNLIEIDILTGSVVLKGYLLSKKIRILILFQNIKWKFIPIYILKKETKKWYNISKDNYIELFWNYIDKITIDIDNNEFEEIEIKS